MDQTDICCMLVQNNETVQVFQQIQEPRKAIKRNVNRTLRRIDLRINNLL